jgi:hypothetical protein
MRRVEFGVIPVFRGLKGRLQPQRPIPFASARDALRAGWVFADVLGGALAYSRFVDREAGTAEDGVIIGRFGVMAKEEPDETATSHRLLTAAE